MLQWLSYLAQAVFLLVVVYFALYMALELRILLISRRAERRKLRGGHAGCGGRRTFPPAGQRVAADLQ